MRCWTDKSKDAAIVVWRNTRRLVIFVIGVTVLLMGAAMVFLPGPGMLVILVGLAILATEFVWARILLKRVKASATNSAKAIAGRDEHEAAEPRVPGFRGWVGRCYGRCRRACVNAIAPFRPGYVDPESDQTA